MSALTRARKVGTTEVAPETGPARTIFLAWVANAAVTVPLAVTAVDGVELSTVPSPVNVTEVTVPEPPPPPAAQPRLPSALTVST